MSGPAEYGGRLQNYSSTRGLPRCPALRSTAADCKTTRVPGACLDVRPCGVRRPTATLLEYPGLASMSGRAEYDGRLQHYSSTRGLPRCPAVRSTTADCNTTRVPGACLDVRPCGVRRPTA